MHAMRILDRVTGMLCLVACPCIASHDAPQEKHSNLWLRPACSANVRRAQGVVTEFVSPMQPVRPSWPSRSRHGVGTSALVATRPSRLVKEEDVVQPLNATFVSVSMTISYWCCFLYTLWSLKGAWKLYSGWSGSGLSEKERSAESILTGTTVDSKDSNELEKWKGSENWSALGIWGLCFYRLYTGFLSATWLPYVLAMEGDVLWPANQSLFMGCCKLIYGVTVLANPICGLLGDKLSEISHGAARRLWILLGIVLSALGIFVCMWAGLKRYFFIYMFGVTLWRTGEALNDVTTEAIVPEMVPQKQFEVASAIKACSFLAGGLFGYILVYAFADLDYRWCYYAYLLSMFATALPSLLLLSNDDPAPPNQYRKEGHLLTQMYESYSVPMSYEGGFPGVSFAIFIMCCGTAPLFFLLLIIRDVLGVHVLVPLERYFAISCLVFFIAAAACSGYDVACGGRVTQTNRAGVGGSMTAAEWEQAKRHKLDVLVVISVVFGLIVVIIPLTVFVHPLETRLLVFMLMVIVFGGTYGFGYSRFQDATWRVLPNDIDMANAMGFNVMCRNLGLGVGNFVAGLVLDFFKVPGAVGGQQTEAFGGAIQASAKQVYTVTGYVWMCTLCFLCNISAGVLAWRVKVYDLKDVPPSAG